MLSVTEPSINWAAYYPFIWTFFAGAIFGAIVTGAVLIRKIIQEES